MSPQVRRHAVAPRYALGVGDHMGLRPDLGLGGKSQPDGMMRWREATVSEALGVPVHVFWGPVQRVIDCLAALHE